MLTKTSTPTSVVNRRFEALDALRGLAAFLVMIFHYSEQQVKFSGYLAVDFFLILSGFVLCHAYYSKPFDFRRFLTNRLARMWPMHMITLVIMAAGVYYFEQTVDFTHLFMQSTLTAYMGFGPDELMYNGPAWTVPVELWVNILVAIPLLFIPVKLKWSKVHLSIMFTFSVALFAVLFSSVGNLLADSETLTFAVSAGFLRGLAGFLLGCVVYGSFVRFGEKLRQSSSNALGIFLLTSFFLALMNPWGRNWTDFAVIPWFAITVFYFAASDTKTGKWLAHLKPLGTVSFSLYLVHMPVFYFFHWSVLGNSPYATLTQHSVLTNTVANFACIVISLGVAALSFRFVEQPIYMKFRRAGISPTSATKTD